MNRLIPKAGVAAALILAGMLQGWPLLVASACTMSELQRDNSAEACCCCPDFKTSETPVYSSCNPAKTLVGVLSTAPSLKPNNKENEVKNTASQSTVIANSLSVFDGSFRPSAANGFVIQTIFAHSASPPLYLLDGVFRI
jgi:hypothetical protein